MNTIDALIVSYLLVGVVIMVAATAIRWNRPDKKKFREEIINQSDLPPFVMAVATVIAFILATICWPRTVRRMLNGK